MCTLIRAAPNYQIYRDGMVQNIKTGRIIKQQVSPLGYYHVGLSYKPGKMKRFYVHKLVADAYLEPSPGKQVNHKDCDKSNNHVENLELVTAKENVAHAIDHGICKLQHCNCKFTARDVETIRSMDKSGMHKQVIADKFNTTIQTIYRATKPNFRVRKEGAPFV